MPNKNPNPNLIPYRVMLHEEAGDKFQIAFDCQAEDDDHAIEQAEDVYPGCEIQTVTPFDPDAKSAAQITLRLSLTVTYNPNGASSIDLKSSLKELVKLGMAEGMITGNTQAEIDDYRVEVRELGVNAALEDAIADYFVRRIEGGDLTFVEDVPRRLASYGLMDAADFADEMQERMELTDEELCNA